MLTVVKLGGRLAGDPEGLAEAVRGIAGLAGEVVIVHGGGAAVTRWFRRLDLPVSWREGLRVTTPDGVEVTSMVLSGWVNKRVVSALIGAGVDAVGLSGEDGGLVSAERKRGGELGEVGSVLAVRGELLLALLGGGHTPVVSPLSRGPDGCPLNVNADEVAIAAARSLSARRLLLLSDVPGVVVDGEVAGDLSPGDARSLLEAGTADGGMRVKLAGALEAAAAGIDVTIGDVGVLGDPEAGTRLAAGRRAAA